LYRVVSLSRSPFNGLGNYSCFRLVKSTSLLSGFGLGTFSIYMMFTIIRLRPTRCGTPTIIRLRPTRCGIEKKWKMKKKMKRKKRGLGFVTLCENWIWKCWSLELLSCLILTYFPIVVDFDESLFWCDCGIYLIVL